MNEADSLAHAIVAAMMRKEEISNDSIAIDSNTQEEEEFIPRTELHSGVSATSLWLQFDPTTSLCKFTDTSSNTPEIVENANKNDSRRKFVKSDRAKARIEASEAPRSRAFNMASSEVDERARNDIGALEMRQFADPSRNYKHEQRPKAGTRFFQLGTVVESKAEFFSSRLKRKDRKRSLADELLDNRATRQHIKHRFDAVQSSLPQNKRARKPTRKK